MAAGLFAFAGTAFAQTPQHQRRLAYLGGISAAEPYVYGELLPELARLGWIVGGNLLFDALYAEGDPQRIALMTSELLTRNPDVFVSNTDVTALAAASATRSVPIVLAFGTDPVGVGLVKSLAAPGRNVTGLSALDSELAPERVAMLKELLPHMRKLGVLFREDDGTSRRATEVLSAVTRSLGMTAVPGGYHGAQDIEETFAGMARSGVQGTISVPHETAFGLRRRLVELALDHRMGAAFGAPEFADEGGLISYGVSVGLLFKRAAGLVDRVLRGANPAGIPVEQANAYEFVVNLRTARALGLQVPRSILLQATRLIE